MYLSKNIVLLLADRFPVPKPDMSSPASLGEYVHTRAYREALESMALALIGAGVAEITILEALATAIDAYGNNID